MSKHKPTTPANRLAIIRGQAERLLQDARALNVEVEILSADRICDNKPLLLVSIISEPKK